MKRRRMTRGRAPDLEMERARRRSVSSRTVAASDLRRSGERRAESAEVIRALRRYAEVPPPAPYSE